MVAQRRHLPGLRPQLRRRQRRRRRRPRRRPGAAAVPARTSASTPSGSARGTCRRWPTAATTSPTTGPSTRSTARSPRPSSSSPRPRRGHPHDRRHRPQPRVRRAPVVPGGAGRRARVARARAVLVPPGPRPRRRRAAQRLAVRVRRRRPGPAPRTPTARPASGTCICSPPSSPTSTGTTPRSAASTRTSFASGSTAAPPASASTPPRCWSRTRTLPELGRRRRTRPAPPLHRPRRAARHLRRAGGAIADSYDRAAGADRRDVAARHRPVRRSTCARRAAHGVQLRLPHLPVGRRPAAGAASIDRRCAAHAAVDAPATWVLSNHDVTRPVTRYGRADTSFSFAAKRAGVPTDLDARPAPGPGRRAAGDGAAGRRLLLPGRGARPARGRGHRARPHPGPDALPLRWPRPRARRLPGCRCRGRATPPPYGFSPAGATAEPWLPQPADWAALTVEAQDRRPGSMPRACTGRRCASAATRARPRRRPARLARPATAPAVLAFARGDAASPASSTSPTPPSTCPRTTHVLLASATVDGGRLAPTPPPGCACRPDIAHPDAGSPNRTLTTQTRRHRQHPTRRHRGNPRTEHDMRSTRTRIGAALAVALALGLAGRLRRRRRRRRRDGAAAGDEQVTISVSNLPPETEARRPATRSSPASTSSRRPTRTSPSSPTSGSGTSTTFSVAAGRRHPADHVRDPVHLRPDADRARPARRHHRRGRGAALRRRSSTPTCSPWSQDDDGNIYGVPTAAYGMGLHYNRTMFEAGRPRPRPAADDVGRGPRVRQGDLRRHGPGRLRADDPEQHRRLDRSPR